MTSDLRALSTSRFIVRRARTFLDCLRRLLAATPIGEDPVTLLQTAARDHIPVSPKSNGLTTVVHSDDKLTIPGPEERPSIDEVIQEIQEQEWYKNQVVDRRTFDAREARQGKSHPYSKRYRTSNRGRSSQGPLTSHYPKRSKKRYVTRGRSARCICIRQAQSTRSRKSAMSSCRPVLPLERV